MSSILVRTFLDCNPSYHLRRMDLQTFIVIGRIPGQCVMIHMDDLESFTSGASKLELSCVVIDLLTGKLSEPITIQQLMDVCPFDEVTEMGEISVLSDQIVEILPEWKVKDINKTIAKIKRPFNRLEVVIGHPPPKQKQ